MKRPGAGADGTLLTAMLKAFDHGSRAEKVVAERLAVAAVDDPVKMDDPVNGRGSEGAVVYRNDRYVGVWNARFDGERGVRSDCAGRETVPELLFDHPEQLRGDFAMAVADLQGERLVLSRDPLGTRPLYYIETSGLLAFATEMKALKALPDFVAEMDETWIADNISTVQSEKWRTPYTSIRRVLPGCRLLVTDSSKEEPYWDLKVQEEFARTGYVDAVALFREKMQRAVANRMRGDAVVAAELSGGLDSSGVTAMAVGIAGEAGQGLIALTHAFSEESLGKYFPYNDEREFSQELCRFAGLQEQIMCDADGYGLLGMLKRNIFIQSGPTQQGYSMFSDTLYDRGKERGVTKILSGFGGDEGVTSKSGGFFEELARQGRWELYRSEFFQRGSQSGTNRVRHEATYIIKRYFPFAQNFLRDLKGRSDWRKEKYPGLGFTREFEERMGIEKRFYERLGFPDDPDVRARQYKRIMHDHVSQRFEYSYIDAKWYGMEYAYPLWDIELLEFYYALPAEYKFRNGLGRAIYRDAMEGLLPERIRLRNDKTGATVPTVQQRFLRDDRAITQLIERSRENNRYHYLDYDRMLAWQERIRNRGSKDKIPANPAAFFNSLQILLLQEMEREGEYRTGIRW